MFRGIVEHRISPRASFKTELIISFSDEAKNEVIAESVDISAGGIQFWVPFDKNFFREGDCIKLLFNLPIYGKTHVDAIIRYSRPGVDPDHSRIVYYGARFMNLAMETWNAIIDFSRATIESIPGKTPYYHDRNDIRINAGVDSKIYLGNNHYHSCQIKDISFGGVKLRIGIPLPDNTPVNLLILDPEDPFEIDGVSVWAEASDKEGEFFTGIFFNQLDLEIYNKLRSYIFKLVAEHESSLR